MHLVWKRPDGFHGAVPSDFQVVEFGQNFGLWLHKSDKDQYPFRIAGGWEEKEATIRLNNLVNLVGKPKTSFVERLKHSYDHSMKDDRQTYFDELVQWLDELQQCAKGDTWEVEIMVQAVKYTKSKVLEVKQDFLVP